MKVCVLFVMFVCVCVCAGKVGRVEEWENGEDGCKGVNVRWESTNVCPDVCPSVPACPNCVCECVCPKIPECASSGWDVIGKASSIWTLISGFVFLKWLWGKRGEIWEIVVKMFMCLCVRGIEREKKGKKLEGVKVEGKKKEVEWDWVQKGYGYV